SKTGGNAGPSPAWLLTVGRVRLPNGSQGCCFGAAARQHDLPLGTRLDRAGQHGSRLRHRKTALIGKYRTGKIAALGNLGMSPDFVSAGRRGIGLAALV